MERHFFRGFKFTFEGFEYKVTCMFRKCTFIVQTGFSLTTTTTTTLK